MRILLAIITCIASAFVMGCAVVGAINVALTLASYIRRWRVECRRRRWYRIDGRR